MIDQADRAKEFKALHKSGAPLVLYNIWDAGGAKALADAGAKAIATGSWSMAAAHGFEDGEAIPLDMVEQLVHRIAVSCALPLTVDFEGGYASEPQQVAQNARCILRAGAIGINFEDRLVRGSGLYPVQDQALRIKAIREMAMQEGIALFINARTDLFLGTEPSTHGDKVDEAIARAAAYKEAGADGFFVPGLTDAALIKRVVDRVDLPVNVMMMGGLTSVSAVAALGVSRASYGPAPYMSAVDDLTARFRSVA